MCEFQFYWNGFLTDCTLQDPSSLLVELIDAILLSFWYVLHLCCFFEYFGAFSKKGSSGKRFGMSVFAFWLWRQINYKKHSSIWKFLHLFAVLCLSLQLLWLYLRYWLPGVQTDSWFSTINLLFCLLSFKAPVSFIKIFFKVTLTIICSYFHWINLVYQWKISLHLFICQLFHHNAKKKKSILHVF